MPKTPNSQWNRVLSLNRRISTTRLVPTNYNLLLQALCQLTKVKATAGFCLSTTRYSSNQCRETNQSWSTARMEQQSTHAATTSKYPTSASFRLLVDSSGPKVVTWSALFLNAARTYPTPLRLSSFDCVARALASKRDPNKRSQKNRFICVSALVSISNIWWHATKLSSFSSTFTKSLRNTVSGTARISNQHTVVAFCKSKS